MQKNRIARFALVAALGLGALLVPGQASALGTLKGFTSSGPGCPAGTAHPVYDDVNDLLTINFDSFSTLLPPGVSRQCNLTFIVGVPTNFQVSLYSVEYLGYLDTDPGVKARLFRLYKYGSNTPFSKTDEFTGPINDNWYIKDPVLGQSICTNQVTILANTRIDLQGTPMAGHINEFTVDNIQFTGGKVLFQLHLTPC